MIARIKAGPGPQPSFETGMAEQARIAEDEVKRDGKKDPHQDFGQEGLVEEIHNKRDSDQK
jgi:hypothetical protein